MKVCFFAHVPSVETLERVEFYSQDIRILKELAREVVVVTRIQEIPGDCDLYFVWWWTYAIFPLVRAKLSGKPVIITGVFDYDTPPRGTGAAFLDKPRWQQWLMRMALATATANVFVSEYEFERVPKRLKTANPLFVPITVDVERYAPGGEREPVLFNVAWSGALNAQRKCLFEIIQAMPKILKRHPDVRLVMAGKQGEAHADLVQLARSLKVDEAIDFIGVISDEEKIEWMQRCAVYLSPTRFEGFGLAIAEAMACGATVVTCPFGAVPEVVGDAGLLIESPEPDRIANAVNELLADRDRATKLGAAARERIVSHFSYETRKAKLGDLVTQLIARR